MGIFQFPKTITKENFFKKISLDPLRKMVPSGGWGLFFTDNGLEGLKIIGLAKRLGPLMWAEIFVCG